MTASRAHVRRAGRRDRWRNAWAAVCLALTCSVAGAQQTTAETRLTVGDHEFRLHHGGRSRAYHVRVPPAAEQGAPLPLVLNFHGGGGSPDGHKRTCGMDAVADREGFLVVYPAGTGKLLRRLLTWNAGTCCGYARTEGIDDVGFALAVIDHLAARTPVDPTRVYATGHSNGGMMAYRLANEAADRLAAVASVAGGMVVEQFGPARPLPVLHVHSVDDPRALYAGGLGPPFPFTDHRTEHPAIEAVLARWAVHNGRSIEPQVTDTRAADRRGISAVRLEYPPAAAPPGPDTPASDPEAPDPEAPDSAAPDLAAPDPAAPDSEAPDSEAPDSEAPDSEAPDREAGPAAVVGQAGGRSGAVASSATAAPTAEVVFWKLTGAGHAWPGGGRRGPERVIGRGTRVIDASEEIWAFFRRHRLPAAGAQPATSGSGSAPPPAGASPKVGGADPELDPGKPESAEPESAEPEAAEPDSGTLDSGTSGSGKPRR